MIGFIDGTVEHISGKTVIVSTGGVGYPLIVIPKILASLSKNQTGVKMYVHAKMHPREGTFDFYGFTKPEDLELFRALISVSGLGPKTAMQILGSIEPHQLKEAVASEDPHALRTIAGLGLKTAQRLIVELAGKLDYIATTGSDIGRLDQEAQVLEALLALGYSASAAKEALKNIKSPKDLSDRVRQALQLLAKK